MTHSIPAYRPMTPAGAIMGRLLARLDGWLYERRRRSEVREILSRMGERDLRDLAISRADIPAIIEGTYRR